MTAPVQMGGSRRMHDPTEAEHDRRRRRWMNLAFLLLVTVSVLHGHASHLTAGDVVTVLALVVAAWPLGLAVRVFELRFKVSADQRRQFLAEVPRRRQLTFAVYAVLLLAAVMLQRPWAAAALWGVWLHDFWGYYRHRPERMRHVYAVAGTLEALRRFPAPWAWALPALLVGLWRLTAS